MRIAVQGCGHGEIDQIFAAVKFMQTKTSIDLLIMCGDFQAIRNKVDLTTLSCPPKFRHLGDFHKYYSKSNTPPCPVLFIGGNHEASNYLWELYHGGWAAKDIYFLGTAGVVNFGGVRIGGISGIYKPGDYEAGFFERHPLKDSDVKSIYHIRKYTVYRMAQLKDHINVFISHDWPRNIANFGNTKELLSKKKHFTREVQSNSLGSLPGEFLLNRLKPSYWFAAHLHVKFAAVVDHTQINTNQQHQQQPQPQYQQIASSSSATIDVGNPDEIQIDDSDDEVALPPPTTNPDEIEIVDDDDDDDNEVESGVQFKLDRIGDVIHTQKKPKFDNDTKTAANPILDSQQPHTEKFTKFLALDKCMAGRDYLQVLEIPSDPSAPLKFSYDPEWLSIVKATERYFSFQRRQPALPDESLIQTDIQEARKWVVENISDFGIPDNFCFTAPAHVDGSVGPHSNPQTEEFCRLVGIDNKINVDGLRFSPENPFKTLI